MKTCFISHSARLGGAEMVLLETIEVLQESGVQCYAVLPARGPLLAELEKLHVPTLRKTHVHARAVLRSTASPAH